MLSLIEVQCPHCGAQGQMMLPPLGAIIVGPCPECEEMVVVFCGRVFALSKDTMLKGTEEEKRSHVENVLSKFLNARIERLFTAATSAELPEGVRADSFSEEDTGLGSPKEKHIDPYGNGSKAPISKTEIESFKDVDLRLIDNPDYFRAVFD